MSIPVVLLTGCLGAGKTTVLNRLLASPEISRKKPALIINEFGKLGVDGKLVPGGTGRKYEINKGSLFCTCTHHQFVQALSEIADIKPGLVLIESTGIAETRNIEGAIAIPALTSAFHLQANLCIVDAINFVKVAAFLSIAITQVHWADAILISKSDQVPAEDIRRLKEILAGMNAAAPVHEAPFGNGVEAIFSNIKHVVRDGGAVEVPPADIVAVSIECDQTKDRARFLAAVAGLGQHLLRLKGNVNFSGEGRRFVEVIYGRISEGEAKDGFATSTAFTAIGWRIDRDELTRVLSAE